MDNRTVLYANGTFDNRGCEAIARGAINILHESGIRDISLCTSIPALDEKIIQELDATVIKVPRARESVLGTISEVMLRLKMYNLSERIPFPLMKDIGNKHSYSFAMGGDNYCYPGQERFYRQNRGIRTKNSINSFWGCSIEEQFLNKSMMRDLKGYDYIFPREVLTFNLLKKCGLKNVIQCTDPAFVMESKECNYELKNEKYIGINISPLTLSYSKNSEVMFNSLVCAIKELIDISGLKVLLIPHVIYDKSDSFIHNIIKEKINNDKIVILGDKYSAPEIKYIIGNSTVFIGARTHATIAAYSMHVPTLVLGYSIKAKGIATDIYGDSNSHVIPVQNVLNGYDLSSIIIKFWEGRLKEKKFLDERMPEYIKNAYIIRETFK